MVGIVDTGAMSNMETRKGRGFQFRLVTLMAWITLWAVFLGLVQWIGFWLAFLLVFYLLAIAAIRTEFGSGQGSVIAALGTAIIMFPVAPLVGIPLGLVFGYSCFLLIHFLAHIGAWEVFDLREQGATSDDEAGDSEQSDGR